MFSLFTSYFQVVRKSGEEYFWIVKGSSVERCGPVNHSDKPTFPAKTKEDNMNQSLHDALCSPASSTVQGKVIQVSNNLSPHTFLQIILLSELSNSLSMLFKIIYV